MASVSVPHTGPIAGPPKQLASDLAVGAALESPIETDSAISAATASAGNEPLRRERIVRLGADFESLWPGTAADMIHLFLVTTASTVDAGIPAGRQP